MHILAAERTLQVRICLDSGGPSQGSSAPAQPPERFCLTFAQTLGVAMGERSGLQAWYGRVGERPVVKAELEAVMAAAAAA